MTTGGAGERVTAPTEERYGTVRDWMTAGPVAVPEDCTVQSALRQMSSADIRHLLVLDGDRLSGIVSNRDVRRLVTTAADAAPLLAEPVRRIMTEEPVTVTTRTPVTVAARLLLDLKIGALPVRDGAALVGIFTSADALEALLAAVEPGGCGT
jgi:CBS domain-containing protein